MVASDAIIRHVTPYQQGIHPLPHGLIRFRKLEINLQRIRSQIHVEKARVRGEPAVIFIFNLPFLRTYPVITPVSKRERVNQVFRCHTLRIIKHPYIFRFAYSVRILITCHVEIPVPQIPYQTPVRVINLYVEGHIRLRGGDGSVNR